MTRKWQQPDSAVHRWVYTDGSVTYATAWEETVDRRSRWIWHAGAARGLAADFRAALRDAEGAIR